jgi:hypothetical protein
MSDLQFPSWQGPLRDAQQEDDPAKAREKVDQAETAIFFRGKELRNAPDGQAEREAMQRGIEELLRIKSEKLGWPPLRVPDRPAND